MLKVIENKQTKLKSFYCLSTASLKTLAESRVVFKLLSTDLDFLTLPFLSMKKGGK